MDTSIADNLARQAYGKLVATLSRRLGPQHIEDIEDAVQLALIKFLETWPAIDTNNTMPLNKMGWLYKVAYRHLLSEWRTSSSQAQLLNNHTKSEDAVSFDVSVKFSRELSDDFIVVLFSACANAIPAESQLVFTLKTLCGFSTQAIALRLMTSEANVYKRHKRARQFFINHPTALQINNKAGLIARLDAVLKVLYLLFTEGYLAAYDERAIRADLCKEALRLTSLIAATGWGKTPQTLALMALMNFHLAKISSRQTDCGELILLEHQDREKWDRERITQGMWFLSEAAQGDTLSRYHVEAGIAAEHCMAKTFAATNWQKIVKAYTLLDEVAPSPINAINKAIAVAEWQGANSGIKVFEAIQIPSWFRLSYHWYAVYADLLRRVGDKNKFLFNANKAIQQAPTHHIKTLLKKRYSLF